MDRRVFFIGLIASIGTPAFAQSITSLPSGTRIFSSDGRFVGAFRSRARDRSDGVRLFINAHRSDVFRRIDEDVIADVASKNISVTSQGVVLAADSQTLRNALKINRSQNSSGRLRLLK